MTARGCLVIGSDTGVGTSLVSASLSSFMGENGPLGEGAARGFELPVVLVVGLRAACLDSALLAARELRARGSPVVGWVGNTVDRHVPWPEENIHTLRLALQRRHGVPCLGVVPWLARPEPAAVASFLDKPAICAAVGGQMEPRSSDTVAP